VKGGVTLSMSWMPMDTLERFLPMVRCSFSCISMRERMKASVMVMSSTTPATMYGRTSLMLSSRLRTTSESST